MRPSTILLTLAGAAAVMIGVVAPGCSMLEPRTTSPYTGRPATSSEIESQRIMYEAEREKIEAREAREAEAELRRLRMEAEIAAKRIANGSEEELDTLRLETETRVADVVDRVATNQSSREAEARRIAEGVELAIQDLNRQQSQRSAILSAVGSIPGVAAAPGYGAVSSILQALLIGGGGTLVGGAVAARGKRELAAKAERAEEERDEEAERASDAEETLAALSTAATRVVDSIDVLRTKVPAINDALKDPEVKDLLNQWQGAEGKALVDRAQRGEPITPGTKLG
jgi:hypothetical protein